LLKAFFHVPLNTNGLLAVAGEDAPGAGTADVAPSHADDGETAAAALTTHPSSTATPGTELWRPSAAATGVTERGLLGLRNDGEWWEENDSSSFEPEATTREREADLDFSLPSGMIVSSWTVEARSSPYLWEE
jgi:hypothetical protein